MPEYPKDLIKDLIEGRLSSERVFEIQKAEKDKDRFEKVMEIEQERVPWKEKILVPLQEHLYVVEKEGKKIVKCSCGYEFGDYRENWKLNAGVYVRDTEEKLDEIYRGPRKCDPEWQIIREFYCPGCGVQLEVEAVPPGYPIIFDFLPDLGEE